MGLYHDFLAKISGNTLMQRFLAAQVRSMNHARGIGTSGDFSTDGEFVVFDLIRKNCQPPYCIFDVGSNSGQFLEHVLNLITSWFRQLATALLRNQTLHPR